MINIFDELWVHWIFIDLSPHQRLEAAENNCLIILLIHFDFSCQKTCIKGAQLNGLDCQAQPRNLPPNVTTYLKVISKIGDVLKLMF